MHRVNWSYAEIVANVNLSSSIKGNAIVFGFERDAASVGGAEEVMGDWQGTTGASAL